jgi:malonate transporter
LVAIISVLYGGIIFVTAWMTGRRDGRENFLFDAGFRWNMTTFVVWGVASEAWFLLGLHSAHETIRVVHITLLIWSFFLLLHFLLFLILRRRTIKGVHKMDIFDIPAAQAINKFVFFVATPALIFSIVSGASGYQFDWRALGLYFLAQVLVYAGTTLFMHRALGCEKGEALLLGMTTVFVNHVFFVLPIAERIYDTTASQPIAGIVLVDAGIVFCGSVLAVDLMQAKNPSPLKVAGLLVRNPFLIASALGILSWIAQPVIPRGLFTYADFTGAAAAPASLFALGIILASNPIRPIGIKTWSVVAAKIVLHPTLVFIFASLVILSSDWRDATLLVAAGPCGAMPFVIALQYGIRTETIAKAVLISTLFSLVSLSVLTA